MQLTWPTTADDLAREQDRLARCTPEPWVIPPGPLPIGACAVVFGRAGGGDLGWAAAVVIEGREVVATSTRSATMGAPFEPGQLALREGPILEAVVRGLRERPVVLVVARSRS